MKKILLTLALSVSLFAAAQVPQGIQYQAVALNGASAVTNSNVGVRLSILNTAPTGTVLYTETHVRMTNAQGLFNLVIGQGTPVTGTFAGISWGGGSKYLKVEMDIAGGTNYALVGTTELLSVPYAMVAGGLATAATGSSLNDQINESSYANYGFIDYYANKAYVFNTRAGVWSNQAFDENASPDLIPSKGSFAFVDYYANKAYAFSGKTGNWSSQAFDVNASPELIESVGNYAFIDYYANKAYAFNSKTGTWVSQTFNENASPDLVAANGCFAFIDYYDNKAYAFNPANGSWKTQAFNENASPDLTTANGSMAFIDYYDNKAYVFYPTTGVWVAQVFDENASPTMVISSN